MPTHTRLKRGPSEAGAADGPEVATAEETGVTHFKSGRQATQFLALKLRAGGRRGLQARRPSAAPQWPIHSGRSVRTDDAFAARGMVSRRRSSQMAARRHNAGSKCEANSRLISKGRQ